MKCIENQDQNQMFIFLVPCLLWLPSGACIKLSFKFNSGTQSPSRVLHLEKRSNFLRYGFAVCELPFYEVCQTNVSRIECTELGCCYHKETCYKKAVPSYMKAFIALIVIILAVFTLFMLQSCLGGMENLSAQKKKNKEDKESVSDTDSTSESEEEEDEED
ncbi:testis-expressed protein 29 isoform X1 [Pantherophis guttatus]|uniref:Testis-expressed protein 29 isoform X1 n=1 Tax=Pantherophis guttatus TaxID=94885 RepID=A0A6P9BTH8_PANGU|nr:testis-expressed protein 29 isoform X1 [Pantherophis guttatus]